MLGSPRHRRRHEARDSLGSVPCIRELPDKAVLPLSPLLDGDAGILRWLASDLAVIIGHDKEKMPSPNGMQPSMRTWRSRCSCRSSSRWWDRCCEGTA